MKIVGKVPADRDILFVPDQNLGQWVSKQTGRACALAGSCYAHVLFTQQAIERLKLKFPTPSSSPIQSALKLFAIMQTRSAAPKR